MSHSVVKVTEDQTNDSLILVIGEDGTVTPDKETVESYLKSKSGATELQVMHVNKIDGQNLDVTLDTLMYVHSEEVIEEPLGNMDEIARNLLNFRMDHDYTPLTSPKRQSPIHTSMSELDDELAQTLSILEGTELKSGHIKPTKVVKVNTKTIKKPPAQINRQKAKMISVTPAPLPKQTRTPLQKPPTIPRPKQPAPPVKQEESDELEEQDSDFDIEFEEDDSDSDFEIEESVKVKPPRKTTPRRRSKPAQSELTTPKPLARKAKLEISPKLTQEPTNQEAKAPQPIEKKPPPKKEKKIPKPPEDFALFSTPDIIRRVGGKEPVTPTTPNSPQVESPKMGKPAKIMQESRTKSTSNELPKTNKRVSTDQSPEKARTSTEDRDRKRERKPSTDKTKVRQEGHVSVQGYDESIGSNSSESLLESQLEPLPSAEDIRAIIQNENTKSFTTSLMSELEQGDQNHVNLESGGLDLDQSILDNINTDLISEDILYQVAQSLVDNPELQNVIDKSIVDGNLMLDTSLQQAMAQEPPILQQTQANTSMQLESNTMEVQNVSPTKGTQIVRSDGRIVVIPPIERPTTRSRNKRHDNQELRQVSRPVKPLDEEHVSGNELDSSDNESEEDESEDDPNKLWCICNQPHNNRFMICCDTCEEWYHGKCVNVTKAMGQMMEHEGKEWICLYCKDPSLHRPSAAARRIRKASRTSTDSAGSQRKSSTASLTEPTAPACIVCGKPSRNSSIYCSDGCILKHAQGVEKVVVFERRTGRILSGASAPSAANLDAWLQEHPGFEVVRSTSKPSVAKKMSQSKLQIVKNSMNDGVSLAVQRKGVNIGVLPHSPKQSHPSENVLKDKATHTKEMQNKLHKKITGLKIISRQVSVNQPKTKLIQPVPLPAKTPAATSTPSKPKQPIQAPPTTPPTPKEKPMPQKTPKARQAEVNAQPQQENIRENVKKTLMEQLLNRIKMADDLELNEEQVASISSDIETQLFKCFGDTGQKYRNRYRSLIFNIKDVKNQTLWRKICEKSINPYQLVRLSPDDLASQELALWREREAKHQLDMIKKSELELLSCNRQFVFKTHKGEQVFEDDRPKDQTVTEVITGLGADRTSSEKEEGKRDGSKEGERKSSKHKKDHSKDKERKSSREKVESKEKRRDRQSASKDRDKERERDRRKRSRSREHSTKHLEKKRSRSRDRDRHRRATHKSSRHGKKDVVSTTDKLDNKSKEILKQLVDKQIVPPLEDRLWKHVPQEDIVPVPNAESDSDHEPSSTVTIPTPPRSSEPDEVSPPMQELSEILAENSPVSEKGIRRTSSVDSNELFSPKDNDSGGLSPVLRNQTEHVWKGTINMIDVAQISITAHEVSGDCNGLSEELPPTLDIVGRISPDTVWEYIGKMRCSNSKMISLLRLNATNMEEKMPYIALYSYLSSRNRLGVVKSPNKAVKDFYILPLASRKPIPQALLPISGPGFEESRPPLLLGIIVRDKRKRSYLDSIQPVASKRSRLDAAVIPTASPATPPISTPTPRSYTPPPSRDPRLKTPYVPPSTSLPSPPATTASAETPIDDMDEPYSPEDSDPETIAPPQLPEPPRLSTSVLPTKPRSFLETGLVSQTFKPFSNKFETIPGLEDASSLPANSQELQRKMAELDQRIAMQKAELQNMSQHIVSSASAAEIGTSALANIALPSNLQQILDSIKTIRAATSETSEPQQTNKDAVPGTQTDLTIPLMLPKISSRSLVGAQQKHDAPSPTIPLNLPKPKVKPISATNSPQQFSDADKSSSSVLSSLSEEDLIRKANEMLGETSSPSANKKQTFTPSTSYVYTPPPVASPQIHAPQKRSKIDLNQPPIPGLEDEC